ncbi:hypothetical protein EMIT0P201_50256 [Pseudomonas chlororaphis]
MLIIVKMAPAIATSKLSIFDTEPASISTPKKSIKRGATKQAMSAFMKFSQCPMRQTRLYLRHYWQVVRTYPVPLTQLCKADHSCTHR